jgi:acetyl esterase/lipase
MLTHIIPIRDDVQTVSLETYLLKNSPEFQTNTRRPAVMICPGGGYQFTSDREAEPVALRFLAHGYHAFVLRYSVQTRFPQPMLDLAEAISIVREKAEKWLVDADRLAVCGFSAGGHLVASLGVMWHEPWLSQPLGMTGEHLQPHALILGYPLIDLDLLDNTPIPRGPEGTPVQPGDAIVSTVLGNEPDHALKERYHLDLHVSPSTPPTFLWHTAIDQLVPSLNALRFATALAEHRVSYELHIFESGVHGLSLADETTDVDGRMINPHTQIWIDLALEWLKRQTQKRSPSTR